MASMEIRVEGGEGANPAYLSELTRDVRDTALASGADSAEHPRGHGPEGTKGAVEIATLVVEFSGTLPVIVQGLRALRRRYPGARLRLGLDGDGLTLGEASIQEERRLADAFLGRHADEG
ncbi:MAG TPA: hypothetical protein VF712_15000 [Thermoleophilaceae bacterium]|jgi:hypothetical protein